MTPGERVRAAVKGDAVDRVPLCFWHHFKPAGSGHRLAELTMEFFVRKFRLDLVKIMPDLPYPPPPESVAGAYSVPHFPALDLETGMFGEQLVCIRKLRSELADGYPLILTMFSPFTTIARFLGRTQAIEQIRRRPESFGEALAAVTGNLRGLAAAAVEAGADGIFFSCMGATSAEFTRAEYADLIRPHDVEVLQGAAAGWLNTVHVHADPSQAGDQIYLGDFVDYAGSVLSWSDRLTGPSLAEASTLTGKCLMGGLWERGPLTHGGEQDLEKEMLDAVQQTGGRRLILANGCSVPDDVDERWLLTARRLLDG